MTITLTNIAINYIEEQEIIRKHEAKAKKVLIKQRVDELVAQGIDKEIAKVMAKVEWEYRL